MNTAGEHKGKPLANRAGYTAQTPLYRPLLSQPQSHHKENDPVSTAVQRTHTASPPARDDLLALVLRARKGDRDAFGEIVLALQKPLYFAVLRLVQHSHDARDIVQRAFLRAWTRCGELAEPEKFRSWLFAIGMNLARNHLRDQGRKRFEPVEDAKLSSVHDSAAKALDRHQQRALLRQALQELPPRQREVVTLRIDAELSFRDIGETVGTTEATARVNFHHGMKRLRDMMRAQGETHPESPGTTSRNRRTP